jgi:UDP-N-acetylglucosamine 2-epimerase
LKNISLVFEEMAPLVKKFEKQNESFENGNTATSSATALAAFSQKIPVGDAEAGILLNLYWLE